MQIDRGGRPVGPHAVQSLADAASADLAPPAAPSAAAIAAEPKPLTHSERRLIVMTMMMPVFMGSIDQSILASALPTIGRVFGNVHDLPWVITSYLIAATALTPLYGKFADIHGRRASLLIALGIYMVGSLVSATSTSMLMLIGGRIIQGCGGGGLVTTSQMVLGDIAPPKDRAKYYAYFSIAFTSAGACGPAVGGWICQHWHWSLIFLWKFPFCLVAGALVWNVLRRLPRYDRPHRLDIVGAVLVMAASSSFMLALNLGGVRFPWLSAPIMALLACALLLGVAFVMRLLSAAEPLIPIAVLADPTARLAVMAHCFGWGSLIGLNIFLPMYLQSALGWSPTDAGLSLIVLMVTLNASAGLSSQLIGRVKHYKALPTAFLVVGIGGVLALSYSTSTMTPEKFEILLFLIGIGFGPTAPLTQVVLQNAVATHHLGTAIGTMSFCRTLLGTVMVAVFGAIVLSGAPADGLGGNATSTGPFSVVFLAAAGTLTITFLAMLLVEEKPLQSKMPAARA
ncbi:MAG TPA: MFS transporter [Xanthobacteraceae bacterium]|nr:MFS transporter [Xanthobacteraceae bacterium]